MTTHTKCTECQFEESHSQGCSKHIEADYCMTTDTLTAQLQEEAKKVRDCQVRWQERSFAVVCGAPFPCSKHTSQEERDDWINNIIATAVQRAREYCKECGIRIELADD